MLQCRCTVQIHKLPSPPQLLCFILIYPCILYNPKGLSPVCFFPPIGSYGFFSPPAPPAAPFPCCPPPSTPPKSGFVTPPTVSVTGLVTPPTVLPTGLRVVSRVSPTGSRTPDRRPVRDRGMSFDGFWKKGRKLKLTT